MLQSPTTQKDAPVSVTTHTIVLKLGLLALLRLVDKRLVNVRNNTTTSNSRLDQSIQLFVTTNGELQMPRRNTLDLQVLAGIAGQFQHFGREILENSGSVDGSRSTNTMSVMNRLLEETVHTTDRKLKTSLGRTRLGSLFGGWGLATLASLAAFSTFSRL